MSAHGASCATSSSGRSGAVSKPVKAADRANSGCRYGADSRLRLCENALLFRAGHQEREIAAAVEHRIGQCDPRLRHCADDSKSPPLILFEGGITWEQRGGVPIFSDSKQRHVENRSTGIQPFRAIETF